MDLEFDDFAGDNREVEANRFEIRRASARCVSRMKKGGDYVLSALWY